MKLPLNVDLKDKVVVVTGAGGILCSLFAKAVAKCGGKVALLDLNLEAAEVYANEITAEGGVAKAYKANVLDKAIMEAVHAEVVRDLGTCD
ncbi:MAG: SDR family NAD(P)-dependent oxidoreductase, partial [Cellulosilyticaceae bacterium]